MNYWIPTKGLFADLCLHEKNQPGPVHISNHLKLTWNFLP